MRSFIIKLLKGYDSIDDAIDAIRDISLNTWWTAARLQKMLKSGETPVAANNKERSIDVAPNP